MHEAAVLLEPENRRFRWVGRLARRREEEPALDELAEALAVEARARRGERMTRRDRRASLAISFSFLATAVTLAAVVDTSRTPSVWTAVLLVLTYAVASRVEFEIGAGSCVPTELVLVPMLFVLPLGQVPLWVALGLLVGAAPQLVRTGSLERALIPLCASWHAIGPVLVLAIAGERGPAWRDIPIYLVALSAQFAFDFGGAALRDTLAHGVEPLVLARYLRWVFLVDTMLAPIGLAIAFTASASAASILLAVPLIALLAVFARERKVRIDHALELSGAYRGTGLLAETYHEILGEESLDKALERIADTISTLIQVDGVTVVTRRRVDVPEVALFERGEHPAVGTAVEQLEVAMVARGRSEGMFSVWRAAAGGPFDGDECRLVAWFADAAALALDNARARTVLERRAESDSLTMLLNHRAFHERLKSELAHVRDGLGTAALLLLDIDDFKRINDVHGHAVGDMVLTRIANILRSTMRAEDHACRIGGEEFAVIIPAGNAVGATALARRIADELAKADFEPVGKITVSLGIAEAPRHATSSRELAVCADTAMLRAKASGKNKAVVFDPNAVERRSLTGRREGDDLRSVAHLKLLQSLAGKVARLNDVDLIGQAIVDELQTLIDYDGCRVYVNDDEILVPVALRGTHEVYQGETVDALIVRVGEGITGTAAARRESVLVHDTEHCEFAAQIANTGTVDESMVAVPLLYGNRVVGVVVVSKLGLHQFDESDVRLLEVVAGHAAVAIDNARLLAAVREHAAQLEHDFVDLVEAVGVAVDPRTGEEPTQIRALTELALSVGRRLELDDAALRRLELAAGVEQPA